MKKKIVSILLVVCTLVSLFTGCGKEETKKTGSLTIGVPMTAGVSDYDNNAYTKWLEEQTGIDLKFEMFSSTGGSILQQISLLATAGEELPDVFWGIQEMPIFTANELGDAGYFLDLTDLIEKHGKNYKKAFGELTKAEQERITRKGTSESGKFYCLPMADTGAVVQDDLQNMIYINKTWLDKLGLSIPKTVDELYNVLQAFKTQDPNGNGKADEIPMLGLTGNGQNINMHIVNAYLYFDLQNPFTVENGKLSYPFMQDEFRQALQFLNKLYEEELLSDLSFTLSSPTEYRQLYTPSNGVARVGVFNGHYLSYTDTASDILSEYVAFPALADATGKGGYDVVHAKGLYWCNYITKDCEDPELAMQFLDFLYTDEAVTRARHGEKDVTWKYLDEKVTINDVDYYFEAIQGGKTESWGRNGAGFFTRKNYFKLNQAEYYTYYDLEQSMQKWCNDLNLPKEPQANDLTFTAEAYDEKSALQSDLTSYLSSSMTFFITGTDDIDSDAAWNKYLANFEKLNLDRLLELAQEAYSTKTN